MAVQIPRHVISDYGPAEGRAGPTAATATAVPEQCTLCLACRVTSVADLAIRGVRVL
jgi:hypothetical protein